MLDCKNLIQIRKNNIFHMNIKQMPDGLLPINFTPSLFIVTSDDMYDNSYHISYFLTKQFVKKDIRNEFPVIYLNHKFGASELTHFGNELIRYELANKGKNDYGVFYDTEHRSNDYFLGGSDAVLDNLLNAISEKRKAGTSILGDLTYNFIVLDNLPYYDTFGEKHLYNWLPEIIDYLINELSCKLVIHLPGKQKEATKLFNDTRFNRESVILRNYPNYPCDNSRDSKYYTFETRYNRGFLDIQYHSDIYAIKDICNTDCDSAKPSGSNDKVKIRGLPYKRRSYILKRDNYTCQHCGATRNDGVKLEIDHIVPKSKGGTNKKDNLQVLCLPCNRGKSNHFIG